MYKRQPKDGPSAGVALATALLSLFTETPVRNDIAMTGEITLLGEVLPVGGIKEKILAAKRAGIYEVILPKENEKEVMEDLPAFVRDKMTFHFVDNVEQVFDLALVKDKKENPKGENKKEKSQKGEQTPSTQEGERKTNREKKSERATSEENNGKENS